MAALFCKLVIFSQKSCTKWNAKLIFGNKGESIITPVRLTTARISVKSTLTSIRCKSGMDDYTPAN